MKTCTKCGIEKELSEYHNDKSKKTGKRSQCAVCEKNRRAVYYEENKDLLREKGKIDYHKNREKNLLKNKANYCKHREKRKEYALSAYNSNKEAFQIANKKNYLKHKDKRVAYQKEYSVRKKDFISEKKREYYNKNKKQIISRNTARNEKRKKTDTEFAIRIRMRKSFRSSLARGSENKNKPFFDYTGILYDQYINYFKTTQPEEFSQITEKGKYHIDHIIPCSLYDFTDEEEIKKCWHPHNLRIIPAKENIIKSNKLCLQLVDKYNIRHLLPKEVK